LLRIIFNYTELYKDIIIGEKYYFKQLILIFITSIMLGFFAWIVLSFVVASLGKNKNIGYWGTFFLSLFLSPLIGLIIALASSELPKPLTKLKCNHCDFFQKSIAILFQGATKTIMA
jgi:hypothetical protein